MSKLKALGLALVAMFALSAVAASGASAQQGKLTVAEPVTLTGSETGGTGANAFTLPDGSKVECPGATYTGHKFRETPHQLIPNEATTATLTPHYGPDCHSFDSENTTFPVTVTMNGCDYEIHIGETTEATAEKDTYGATFWVVCPPEKQIEVHSYLGGSHGFSVCTDKVPAQGPLSGAHVTHNTGQGDLTLQGTIKGIHATQSGLCGAETFETAELDLDVTVKGHNELGENIDVTVSH